MRFKTLLLLLVSSVAWAPWFARAQAPAELTPQSLSQGEIFVWTEPVEGFDFPRLIVTAVIEGASEDVYEITTNCDRFTERLPRMKSAKTLKRTPTSHICKVTVGLPFPLSDLTAVTIDRRKLGPDEWYRKWKLLPNVETSYKRLVGAFILKPFEGEPKRTLLRYELHAIPKSGVPGFLRKAAQKKSMPRMIARIRAEVGKL